MGSRDDGPERLNRLRGARSRVRKNRLQTAPGLLQCACRYGSGTYRYNPAREVSFGSPAVRGFAIEVAVLRRIREGPAIHR